MKPRCLLILFCLTMGLSAQQSALFPPERYRELREEVVYEEPEEEELEEPLENPFEEWLNGLDLSIFREPLTWILLIVFTVGLALLVYLILRGLRLRKARNNKQENEAVDVEEIVEEEMVQHGVSLSLLERAERAGQYDIAVRLLYISLLKELQDAGQIRYRKDYSNRDYLRQLSGSNLRPDVLSVTRDYERYWYGKYHIDRLSYRVTQKDFSALSERIVALHPQAPAHD
jgi:hypothetical protein